MLERFSMGDRQYSELCEKIESKEYTLIKLARARNNRGIIRKCLVTIDGVPIKVILSSRGKIITVY
jgi:hypothetical protein